MADANFNPKAKLEIDTSNAVQQLKSLVSIVKELKESIDAQNKVNVDTSQFNEKVKAAKKGVDELDETVSSFSKSASVATKAVGQELDNLKNKANQKITFEGLSRALDKLARQIEKIVTKNINDLKNAMKEVGQESQHMATRMNNQHLSRKFGELKNTIEGVVDEIKALSHQTIDVNTDRSSAEFAKLRQQLQQLYDESQRVSNATLDVKDDQARKQLTNLIRLVQKFREEVEALSSKTINVRVTNRGFDKVIQSALRYFTLIDKTNKNILKQTSKEEKNAEKITDQTAQTSRNLERASKHYANMVLNSGKVASNSTRTTTSTQKFGGILLKGFYSMRGISSIFQEIQGFTYQISQYITNIGRTLVSTVVPAFKSMVSDAFEMASQLETSKIGFKLFFPNDNPDELTQEIKRRAVASTAFDSGQMAKYASQFATLTNGDSTLALDAIEGIADLLMASGQEVSTYLEKVVTNTIQVVSYGKATARDWREFTQKIPIFEKILKSIQPELAERMKDENAEITKEDTKYLLEAFQIVHNNSAISGVSSEYAKTFSGLKQVMKESITSTVDNIIESSGFFNEVKRWLQQSSGVADMLNKYLTPLAQKLTTFMSKFKPEDIEGIISDVIEIFKQLVKDIASDWGIKPSDINPKKVREGIKKVVQFVADFVRGWVKGVKQVIDFVKSIMQKFGINPNQVASILGFISSPWGSMVTRLLNALAGAGQLIANVISAFKGTKLASLVSSLTGKIGNFLNPTTFLAKLKTSGALTSLASKIGLVIQGAVQGALLIAAGQLGNDLVYNVTGNTHAGAAVEMIGGAAGGAAIGAGIGSIVPGIGTAIGAALGGLIGGIASAVSAGNKTRERIQQQMTELQNSLKSEYDKLLDEYIPKLTNDVKALTNQNLKSKGMAEIDWKSDAGAYASSQIEKYMRTHKASEWNTADMMKIAYEAYNYQKLRKEMDNFTETKEFRAKTGGGTFDPDHDLNRRNALADVIKAAKLLGPNYDYGTSSTMNAEGIVRDYLNGNTLSNDQVNAIIDKYNSLEQGNKTLEEQFAENISKWNAALITANEYNSNLVSLLGATNKDMTDLKTAINDLEGTIDGKKYTLDLNGNLTEKKSAAKKNTTFVPNTSPLLNSTTSGLGGITLNGSLTPVNKFLGGPLKPVYKAHGGPLGVDTVPVMAQRGEFIVRKSVADKVGLPALTALNLGDTKLAAALMGRPNNNVDGSYNRNWNTSNTDNRKSIRNIVKIINKNTASRLNSGYALANRLALGF